jgi:lysophospholipase L1-like esterase
MEWYEHDVAALVQRLAAQPVAAPAVFYGSSSITLWTTLAADLRCARAVNAGFGGSTLAACEHFFERIVPPTDPAALVVYAGDNDLGDGRSPDDVVRSFRRLAAAVKLRCPSIPFGFIAIKPSPARASLIERIRSVNTEIRREIASVPGGYFIDVFEPMLAHHRPLAELFGPDGLHLNRAGYDVWVNVLAAYRDRFCPQIPDGGATPSASG